MFGLFKRQTIAPLQPVGRLPSQDDKIRARAQQMAQSMGSKFCAAPGSTFQFKPGPTVLK